MESLFALVDVYFVSGLGAPHAATVGLTEAMMMMRMAARYNLLFLGALGLLFVVGAPVFVGFFASDPAVHRYGVQCLRIVAYGFPFYAFGMVLTQSFNGAGDTWTPTVINLLCFWSWEIPLAWVLSQRLGFVPSGVFWAIAVAFSTLAVISGVVFRRGKWNGQEV